MTIEQLTQPLAGQGWVQIGEVLLAFALASLIGLERQLRSKSAGIRTQAIVGTASALMLLVSKYGFGDVLVPDHVVLDPSRVAAQIVSGVGFLGAGLILTRRGAVRGLTTAAAVWETAAIGMAAGAGLWLLALVVTALHFVVVFGYTAIVRALSASAEQTMTLDVVYDAGRGVLPDVLALVTAGGWRVARLVRQDTDRTDATAVRIDIAGRAEGAALLARIGEVEGVRIVDPSAADELE
ncbi:MgtC/SapB family protein [Curtobacterium pusillum]|uniref:MgtC/SapB family protein n=1 Tax=Curtobacterium pusillum TaxID=69373 RepID=A0ABX2M5P2_9MICO|nr:MgtC/SapB family protein [Curtobacterium pusillum]NUU12894.1 MgtC/SapB family protein [Curtobacterium pusillum]GLK30309.1 putative magnesium transport MgtC family protein [Curtobacterium pusillum]